MYRFRNIDFNSRKLVPKKPLLLNRDNHVYAIEVLLTNRTATIMTKSRRTDRYSTHRNAFIVYQYINDRLDEVVYLFRIPGFHHAKFKREFQELSALSGHELSLRMHQFFLKYDKSQPEQFDKFKAKLRRFIFNRAGNRILKINNTNMAKLVKIGEIEGLETMDEIIEMLLFQYNWVGAKKNK